jgi:predicted Fe-Mo cluster-binding NifX family protein
MKLSLFIFTITIITTCSLYSSPAVKRTLIKLDDLTTTITQEATNILQAHGIEVKNLPRKTTASLHVKLNFVTDQLTHHLYIQHKNEIALEVIHKDLEAALTDFIATALTVVSKKVLPQTVTAFITKLVEEKPVNITKLPEKMKQEFEQRKAFILTTLINNMNADDCDYVYVSDLERLCHVKLDLFLERAKYVLISQWGQGAMTALDSLKFVTNTQPFPVQPQQKEKNDGA